MIAHFVVLFYYSNMSNSTTDFDGPEGTPGEVGFVPPVPDAVDLVIETATMMSVFAAERLVRINAMRRDLLVDAEGCTASQRDVLERSIRLELACAMRITEYAAGRLIVQAEALVTRYPAVLDALSGGRITEKHAEIYVDLVDAASPDVRDDVLAPALILAEAQPVGTFRRALRDLIARVESTTLEERFQAAITQRRVWVEKGADGMSQLGLYHPDVEVTSIQGRITAMAKVIAAVEGETRTLDQIRADIVADLLIDGTTEHLPAVASGIRAEVVVTVPALSLLDPDDVDADSAAAAGVTGPSTAAVATGVGEGQTAAAVAGSPPSPPSLSPPSPAFLFPPSSVSPFDAVSELSVQASRPGAATDPPVVEGVGPIPLSVARQLCGGDSKWMRVLTHPETGMVLSVGRDRYQPPAALRRLVKWRADRCMAPGCNMPASRCEVDHQIRWVDGGETCLDNHAPFCKGHHIVKDNTDWVVRQIPDSGGAVEWISPTGRRYIVQPARRVPAFTTQAVDSAGAPF